MLNARFHSFYIIINVMRRKRIDYMPRGYLNPNSLFSFLNLYANQNKQRNQQQ